MVPSILLLLLLIYVASGSIDQFDLPLIRPEIISIAKSRSNIRNTTTGKFIPQNVWVAVRNISDERASHMLGPKGFVARNSNWTVHFCDNTMKDAFMEEYFANTSFLWSYNILNPLIGTAKVELWRLAILYVYGGMYMDDDANIMKPLDEVVEPDDKFIAGKEAYNWTDTCYVDKFALSNTSMNLRYGVEKNSAILFDNKFWFNWALFSMPGNILLERIMQHIVALIKAEWLIESLVKLAPNDHRGKLLMCATTFPITLSARELVLEGRQEEMGLRVGGEMFREYGADMKAWYNDHSPTHWVKMIHKRATPYLRSYAPFRPETVEGKTVQIRGHREIFLVKGGKRHVFNDFHTFIAMNFTLDNVQLLLPEAMVNIEIGDPIPSIKPGK